jgi:hypothetical protein
MPSDMKKSFSGSGIPLILFMLLTSVMLINCKKTDDPYKFPIGVFPDSVINLAGLNSAYDDYNSTVSGISGDLPVVFSSNRRSQGGQFDLEQGLITFIFDKADGSFEINSGMMQDAFIKNLIAKSETAENDFGPYRVFSITDGMEYFILSSVNGEGNLDLKYCTNLPPFGTIIPEVFGPYPIGLLNSPFDDAYLTFDTDLDTAYFISNPEANFDIYLMERPSGQDIGTWFNSDFSQSAKVDSINSPGDDKCPIVHNKMLVFTSNRPGGYGGYDLYYSVFRNGNWNAPVNLGAGINTASDEYRPVIGFHEDFSNIFMIFSSNRPGGMGGFDLYFTGLDSPK